MLLRLLAVAIVVLLASVAAEAQEAPPEPLPAKPVYVADGLLPTDKQHEIIECGRWRTDIVFGLPIALRVQRQIADHGIWAEGGLAVYGFVPSVFAGVRFDGRIYEGKRNAWFSRPGFDMYFSPVHGDGGFLNRPFNNIFAFTFENDISWRRKWNERVQSHIGLKAGLGVAFAGSNVWPVPVLGLTCGFQY